MDVSVAGGDIALYSNVMAMENAQQYTIFEISTQIPVFWLGKFCLTTISDGFRTISDTVFRTVRHWSMNVMVHMLFTGMVILNPRLTEAQQMHLMSAITRALEELFLRHSVDERLMKGLIAMTCPDRGSRILVTYLVEVLKGLASNTREEDLESGELELVQEDSRTARILRQEFSIDHMYIAAMSSSVRKAVLSALMCGTSFELCKVRKMVDTQPMCSITLEPLLQRNGKIGFDVVAVIQGDHAFLYRGTALYKWLGKPQVPISPETRNVVRPMDVYRLS